MATAAERFDCEIIPVFDDNPLSQLTVGRDELMQDMGFVPLAEQQIPMQGTE